MVDLTVADGNLILHVRGANKLWALKSSLEIPPEHIAAIRGDQGSSLEGYFKPPLTKEERGVAAGEGWILGVM
jgi:hypothetical protein